MLHSAGCFSSFPFWMPNENLHNEFARCVLLPELGSSSQQDEQEERSTLLQRQPNCQCVKRARKTAEHVFFFRGPAAVFALAAGASTGQFRTYRAINAVIKIDPLSLSFADEGVNERFLRQQLLDAGALSRIFCFLHAHFLYLAV